MSRLLIDTNIYSDAMRGKAQVVDVLQTVSEIYLTPIIIGELLSGFKGGKNESTNRRQLTTFLASERVKSIDINNETAEYYANILNHLRRTGIPIPTNDIWIAASAMQHELPLFTQDHHFQAIDSLQLF